MAGKKSMVLVKENNIFEIIIGRNIRVADA
jgi:hypothetical protein